MNKKNWTHAVTCLLTYGMLCQTPAVAQAPSSRPSSRRSMPSTQVPPTSRRAADNTQAKLRALQARLAKLEAEKRRQRAETVRRFLELRRRTLNPKGGLITKRKLLSASEVSTILAYKKTLEPLFLQGIPRTPSYDAVQFTRPWGTKGPSMLVAIQVWLQKRPKALANQWRSQLRSYPNLQLTLRPKAGRIAFAAYRKPYRYYNFIAKRSRALVALSCHEVYCKDDKALKALAALVDQRLR